MNNRVVRIRSALGLVPTFLAIGLLLVLGLTACTGEGENATATSPLSAPAETTDSGTDKGTESRSQNAASAAEDTSSTVPEVETVEGTVASVEQTTDVNEVSESPQTVEAVVATMIEDEAEALPLLIDLGAGKCIPCKMMAPILEQLAETKKGYFDVVFIDVWEDRSKGQEYGVSAIPTQIFYSARGEELYRHIGFYSREQILKKWWSLGIDVGE